MKSLRIALALLGLLALCILLLPERPSLLKETGSTADTFRPSSEAAPAAEFRPPSRSVEQRAEVRTVVPSPLGNGPLTRLPPVASGAATPVQGNRSAHEADDAGQTAPTNPAETPTPEASETPAPAEPQSGQRLFNRPIAVDSGTIVAGDVTLHIAGVEPLAPQQRCTQGAQSWPCGARARTAFRSWLRGRSVECDLPPEFAAQPGLPVSCSLAGEDVGQWLISNGWAAATPDSAYAKTEHEAREAKRGIWAYDSIQADAAN